jgi:AmmeMemoRadiSam system protein B
MREHGVGVPLALVETYWPHLDSVTAIVVSRKIDERDSRALARELRAFADEPDTLVVVSVDFSHGLLREEAQVKDRETRRALLEARRSFFWYAQDTHTDFGRGVWILLTALADGGRVVLHQSFDAVDLGGEGTNITTFFTGWLTKD